MSVADSISTFAGLTNENEFYSHHYLAEVFKGDIKSLIEQWQAAEEEGGAVNKAPFKLLQACSARWFALQANVVRSKLPEDRLAAYRELHQPLLAALGYTIQPQQCELLPGKPVPVWQVLGEQGKAPQLIIVPSYTPSQEDEDLLDQELAACHYDGIPVPPAIKGMSMAEVISEALFGADQPPRYIILAGLNQWLLLDRFKWPNNRVLRFDWSEILDRKDSATLQAAAALLHHNSLAPAAGSASLLEGLDENAHKHAFGVSEDLKYALRSAIELLGNEATNQLRQLAAEQGKGFYSGKDALDPEQLSLECLRLVYRLLFMFYIEARPELGYVPIQKSEIYLKGYSLESLRELENVALNTPHAREGTYFDTTLRRLFTLVAEGCGTSANLHLNQGTQGARDTFSLSPLDSRLFDASATPLLNKVIFPNHIWQAVIKSMSVSKPRKGGRPGRVSYQLLSINQLGAVYEALLSYRGFFAAENLYEVQPEPKKAKAAGSEEGDDEGDAEEGADISWSTSTDVLDNAWFVPESRLKLDGYKPTEMVYEEDDEGRKKLRMSPKGSFIYRLAGRDRQKSASYYTPQVLTRCLVKYALKELLKDKTADDILTLTVVEPAMGSAAFLNEAVNQLSEKYLELKQQELKERIPHERYAYELQKVRMYIADRNVFGVDLNPVAVELAEVSLWLNAIYGEPTEDADGNPIPPRPARVPWFGYQLFNGNSLIGARREVWPAQRLVKNANPKWYDEAPLRLAPQTTQSYGQREKNEVFHFLLPDPGMANYTDKVAKTLYPEDFERLKAWRKEWIKPLEHHEIARLQQLSDKIDALWREHVDALIRDRAATEDPLVVWPAKDLGASATPRSLKEETRKKGLLNDDGDLATPYRRLKLVMDYWCALWFWPIQGSSTLPMREQWWMEIGAILEGNIVDLAPQGGFDFRTAPEPQQLVPEIQNDMFGAVQPVLTAAVAQPSLLDKYGQLRIKKLREHFPRIVTVEAIAATRRFMHWELTFADVFSQRGGFDLVLGNPPWLKVEWNEAGILGEAKPLFAIRKFSATELTRERAKAFNEFPRLQGEWTSELEEAEATQNFLNGIQNYPALSGVQSNLYKNFMELSWELMNISGYSGIVHEESIYDDPAANEFRSLLLKKLLYHFQFINELPLFKDVDSHKKFGVSIYRNNSNSVRFVNVANLFHPVTIDRSFDDDFQSEIPSIKNENNKWNLLGHKDRLVTVTNERLNVFLTLFDDGLGNPFGARVPALYCEQFYSILEKFTRLDSSFMKEGGSAAFFEMYHETNATKRNVIGSQVETPESVEAAILSGSHIGVGNIFYQTSRSNGVSKMAFDVVDLELIDEKYIPRTKFKLLDSSANEFKKMVPWSAKSACVDFYRFATKYQISQSMERGYIGCIVPPGFSHLQTIVTVAFKDIISLVDFACANITLPYHFFSKTTGFPTFRSLAKALRWKQCCSPRLAGRLALLSCLSSDFSELWESVRPLVCADDFWSKTDIRLGADRFNALRSEWTWNSPARNDFERRQLLLEMDVLAAQEIGLKLEELLTIWRIVFPVMQQSERDTWYDINGRIVFTNSKGLVGVGLPRKATRTTPKCRIETPDGKVREGTFGWEDLYKDGQWLVPDGTVVTQWVEDDTLPTGKYLKERRWTAPFALANREEDYKIAWAFFAAQEKSDV